MKERFSARRAFYLAGIFAVAAGYTVAAGLLGGQYMDVLVVLLCVDILFFGVFWFLLETKRAKKEISGNRATDFGKLFFGFLVSAALMLAFSRLPAFVRPVILLPVVLTAVGTEEIAFCGGMFFVTVFAAAFGCAEYETLCYGILLVCGCVIAEAVEHKEYRKWSCLLMVALEAAVPSLFSYFGCRTADRKLFLEGLLAGVLSVVALVVFYPILSKSSADEVDNLLLDMGDEEYPLARELKNFSAEEYRHALRVARAAERCARYVGANAAVCRAAGMYYRIGILDGDAIAENNKKCAASRCFPEEVAAILAEYRGKEALPSTVESAIVQMADGLAAKMESFGKKDVAEDGWNREMVIYRTLNEFSAKGLYDASGLSMNLFLKIREFLVKEEELLV